MTVCGRWVGGDGGERTQQETLADRAGASWRGRWVVRWIAQTPALPSVITSVVHDHAAPVAHYLGAIDNSSMTASSRTARPSQVLNCTKS